MKLFLLLLFLALPAVCDDVVLGPVTLPPIVIKSNDDPSKNSDLIQESLEESEPGTRWEVAQYEYAKEKAKEWASKAKEQKLKLFSLDFKPSKPKLNYVNSRHDFFKDQLKEPVADFQKPPEEMYFDAINDALTAIADGTVKEETKKLLALAKVLYEKGNEQYGDEIVSIAKETAKLASGTIPLVAAYRKYETIWKFVSGRDLNLNPISDQERLDAGAGLLHDLVPYPDVASAWLLKSFNGDAFKAFVKLLAQEENKPKEEQK